LWKNSAYEMMRLASGEGQLSGFQRRLRKWFRQNVTRKTLAPQLHAISAVLSLLCGTLARRNSVLANFIDGLSDS
jgi:hypothetical protein